MSTLQSSGLEPAVRLKSLKNAKRRVMPGEEEIQNLDQFSPDIAGTANPMPAPAPTQNMPQPAIGSQVSAQSYDPRANQVMTAPPVPVGPPQPVLANPNPPPSQENLGTQPPAQAPSTVERKLAENLPAAAGIQQPQGQLQTQPEIQPQGLPQPQPQGQGRDVKPTNRGVAPNFSKDRGHGLREDGTFKGEGFAGNQKMKDGSDRVLGEMSVSDDLYGDGNEILYPTVVPGINSEQMDFLLKGGNVFDRPDIIKLAQDHARMRITKGLPTFATEAEEGQAQPIPTPEAGAQVPAEREGMFTRFGKALAMQGGFAPGQKELPEKYKPIIKPEDVYGQQPPEAKDVYGTAPIPMESQFLGPKLAKGAETIAANLPTRPLSQEWWKNKPEEKAEREGDIQAFERKSDEVAASPEHSAEFEKQTGKKLTPELHAAIKVGEEVANHFENGAGDKTELSDQAKRITERIEANKATDADKYMIGLALLMPLIVGGMFGKEAGFGALAGGMKGMGGVLGQRTKDIREDEELLAKVNAEREKAKAELEKGKARPKLSPHTTKYIENLDTRNAAAEGVISTGNHLLDLVHKTGVLGYSKHLPDFLKPKEIADFESSALDFIEKYKGTFNRLTQGEFQRLAEEALPNAKLSPEANEARIRKFMRDAQEIINKNNRLVKIERSLGYIPEDIRSLISEDEEDDEKPLSLREMSKKTSEAASDIKRAK